MEQKKLLESIARLVKVQVEREVEKRMATLRMEVISEVAGMLNYSERKLLAKLDEGYREIPAGKRAPTAHAAAPSSDLDRVMGNLSSMPGFQDRVAKVQPPKKRISSNPSLNDILNETTAFSREEVGTSPSVFAYNDDELGAYEEPWTNTPEVLAPVAQQPRVQNNMPKTIMGIDNRPVDLTNPTVQKVLDIMSKTNYKEKFDRISEAGNQFRGAGAPAPRFSSDYFKQSLID